MQIELPKKEQPTPELDASQITSKKIQETLKEIEETFDDLDDEDERVDPKIKQKLNYAKRIWPKNLLHYEEQEKPKNKRNKWALETACLRQIQMQPLCG